MPPETPPPFDPVDLVLHIGSGKTGTSTMQRFLHDNRHRLLELDTLYPRSPGNYRHVRLGLFLRPDAALGETLEGWQQKQRDPDTFRRNFRHRLFREIADAGASRVILSDESLYGSQLGTLGQMREFSDRISRTLRIVVYLRRQDDHLGSRYQELVKTGETLRMADRVRQKSLTRTYDYYSRLVAWRNIVAPTTFVVRPFERTQFIDGSLHQDFLEAMGIPARASGLVEVGPQNESLDAESVEFLRILNLYRVEHEGAHPGLIPHRPLARRLAKYSRGPTLTLPDSMLDEFMKQWEPSNRAVAREFLGNEGGELFRAARKTRNTTTEQHLQPSRTDHYVEILELPEPIRPLLRKIAEREGRRR